MISSSNTALRNWPRYLLVILGVGALLRLLVWLWFAPLAPQIDDEMAHVLLARNLVVSGDYTFDPSGKPTSLRPPLYPAFIAVVFKVFGGDHYQAVRLIQSVMSLVTIVLVFRLGRDFFSEKVGIRAAAMLCFYPTFIVYNNLMLTETLFSLLFVAGLSAFASGLARSSLRALAFAGLLLGLGALTRSILYPFAPVLAMFLLVGWRGSVLRRVAAMAAFAIPFAGVLTPWAIRNTQLQGTFIPIDCMGGRNFMMGNYEHTPLYRSWDAISIQGDREWFQVLVTHRPETVGSTQGQIDKLALAEGMRFVREHPQLTFQRDVVKFLDFWGLERELIAGANRGYFGPIPGLVVAILGVAICGSYAMILFAGAFGAALRPMSDVRTHLLFLLAIAFICAVHTLIFAHSRYHLPLIPLIAIYAAAYFTRDAGKLNRRKPGFWVALMFCIVVTGGWIWNAAAGDLPKILNIFRGSE